MINDHPHPRTGWPRPPACLPAARLNEPPEGARITVAGLVILRQRPGTAKGVIFVTLEDETGVANIIVWKKAFDRFRKQVMGARLMKISGVLQQAEGVIHVVAHKIIDASDDLLTLSEPSEDQLLQADNTDPVDNLADGTSAINAQNKPVLKPYRHQRHPRDVSDLIPASRDFH